MFKYVLFFFFALVAVALAAPKAAPQFYYPGYSGYTGYPYYTGYAGSYGYPSAYSYLGY